MKDFVRISVWEIAAYLIGAVLVGGLMTSTFCHAEDEPGIALAATYTKLTWNAPTTRTDGVPFDIVQEGGKFKLTWTRGSQTGTANIAANILTYNISSFKANTSFTIVACDDLDVCSVPSNTVVKPGGPPLAPNLEGVQ